MFHIIACYFLTVFRIIRVLNRCGFHAIQKICKYADVVLQKYVLNGNTTVDSNSLSRHQPTFPSTEFYNAAKSTKKIPEVLSRKKIQVKENDIETPVKKLNKKAEIEYIIRDGENSNPGYGISKMQISPPTICFNDSNECIAYNLNDAKRVTVSYILPNNDIEINLIECVQEDVSKPTSIVTKEKWRSDEDCEKSDAITSYCKTDSITLTEEKIPNPAFSDLSKSKFDESEKSDTNTSYCKTDSITLTEEKIPKPTFSDLPKSNEGKHTELSEIEMEANSVKHSSNLISSKSCKLPAFPENTNLLMPNTSEPSSNPDIIVSTSDPSISVELSANNLSKTSYCSESTNNAYFRESHERPVVSHSSEKVKSFSEMGPFTSGALDISSLRNSSPCSTSSGGHKCDRCNYLLDKINSIGGAISEEFIDFGAKVLRSVQGGGDHASGISKRNTNLEDSNEGRSRTETERSLITHAKKVEGNQAGRDSDLPQAGQRENATKFLKYPEIVEPENSNHCKKTPSNNLPNCISECIHSDVNKIKCSSKNSSLENEEPTGSLETTFNSSTELNQGTTDNNAVLLPPGVENSKNSLKDSLSSGHTEHHARFRNAMEGILNWAINMNKQFDEIVEVQRNEKTSFSNIRDLNDLNSASTIELHPEISMIHSNRTEVTEDGTEKVINKEQESHNQSNKPVHSLTEISDADDKELKITNTQEKDSENVNSNSTVVRITKKARIVTDFPRTKKLKKGTYIAKNKQCSKESVSCNVSGKEGDSLTALYESKINYSKSSNNLDNAHRLSSGMEQVGSALPEKVQSSVRPSVIRFESDLSLQSTEDQPNNSEADFPRTKKLKKGTYIAENKQCSKESTSCNASGKGDSLTALYERKINYSKSSNNLDNAHRLSSGMEQVGSALPEKVQSSVRPTVIRFASDLSHQSTKDQPTNSETDILDSSNSHWNVTYSDENLACSLTQTNPSPFSSGDPSQVNSHVKAAFEPKHFKEQALANLDNTNKNQYKEFLKSRKNRKLSNEKSCPSSCDSDQRKLLSETNEGSGNKKSKKSKKKSKQNR